MGGWRGRWGRRRRWGCGLYDLSKSASGLHLIARAIAHCMVHAIVPCMERCSVHPIAQPTGRPGWCHLDSGLHGLEPIGAGGQLPEQHGPFLQPVELVQLASHGHVRDEVIQVVVLVRVRVRVRAR